MATKTDQLTRAWNLLREGERPRGMHVANTCKSGFQDLDLPYERGGIDSLNMTPSAAYDRLVVAVEGVLLGIGFWVSRPDERYIWTRINADHEDWRHTDRLTAACDALEAERGSDD